MTVKLAPGGRRGKAFANRFPGKCVECGTVVPASRYDADGSVAEQRGAWFRGETVCLETGEVTPDASVTLCLRCSAQLDAAPASLGPRLAMGTPRIALEFVEGASLAGLDDCLRPIREDFAVVQIKGGLLGDLEMTNFKAIVKGCAGKFFMYKNKAANALPLATVPEFAVALRRANLDVQLDDRLRALVRTLASAARANADAASARIVTIRSDLATRGEELRPYQELGVEFLVSHPRALLADQQGLGKTAQALLASNPESGVLVVCPAVARGTWLAESKRWRPDLQASTVEGSARSGTGLSAFPPPGRLTVVSFEGLNDTAPLAAAHAVTVIIDEAHKARGGKRTAVGRRVRAVFEATRACSASQVWLMSGTPIYNDLHELWEVVELIGLGTEHFGSKRRFTQLQQRDPDGFVERLRKFAMRREKSDVLADLPPKTWTTRTVSISEEDRERLDAALAELVRFGAERKVQLVEKEFPDGGLTDDERARVRAETQADIAAAIDLAFDGETPIPFEFISRVKAILALAKSNSSMEVLDELEESDPEPVLFYSTHLEPVRRAAARPGWCSITGETPGYERDRLIREFQAGAYRGMALTIKAAGVAITLTRASREVFNDLEWTPAANEQAEDRAHRIGQQSAVQIITLVGDHVLDARILEINAQKRRLHEATVARATRKADERAANAAAELEALMASVISAPPKAIAVKRRPAASSAEEATAAALLEATATDAFVQNLRRDLVKFDRALTSAQWRAAAGWLGRQPRPVPACDAGDPPHSPSTPVEADLAAALVELRVTGAFTDHDRTVGSNLANRVGTIGLTDGEYDFAALLLRKYRLRADAPPC